MFVSEDRQLRTVHLIFDFEPLSTQFQDVGHTIRAGDPQLAQIDIFVPGFLTQEDLPLVELPLHRSPPKVVVPREETASSRLSLEAKIDQFHLEDEREEQGEQVVQVSDFEDKLDKVSGVLPSGLVIARINDSSKDEAKEMALNQRKGLKDLLVGRKKRSASKDAPRSQPLPALPSKKGSWFHLRTPNNKK